MSPWMVWVRSTAHFFVFIIGVSPTAFSRMLLFFLVSATGSSVPRDPNPHSLHPVLNDCLEGRTREVQRETLDWEEEMERLGLCAQLCHHLTI